MKRFLFIICSVTVLITAAKSQITAYQPGERIFYTIHYGLITGGEVTLELQKDTTSGTELWHSVLDGKTVGLVDALFEVRDIYESFIDPYSELPVKSIRNIKEGRYRRYNVVLFDHKTRPDSSILTSDLTGIHIAEKGIHDILSCFYWFRNRILPGIDTIKTGDVITITTWFTDELYPVSLKYIGSEEIKTKAGKLRAYKFNPATEVGRLFKTEEDITIWFSADKNFLPVKIRFNIFVGAFMVELVSYEGLVYPLEIKKR
jgi:hypothetical protein